MILKIKIQPKDAPKALHIEPKGFLLIIPQEEWNCFKEKLELKNKAAGEIQMVIY